MSILQRGKLMKTIKVVSAIIKDGNKIFATKRGYGDYKGYWEFPGGKVEKGESNEQALIREIKEELNTVILVDDFFENVEFDYPDFHLSMDCYLCSIENGSLELLEHEDAKWLTKETLDSVNWLEADHKIIKKLSGIL